MKYKTLFALLFAITPAFGMKSKESKQLKSDGSMILTRVVKDNNDYMNDNKETEINNFIECVKLQLITEKCIDKKLATAIKRQNDNDNSMMLINVVKDNNDNSMMLINAVEDNNNDDKLAEKKLIEIQLASVLANKIMAIEVLSSATYIDSLSSTKILNEQQKNMCQILQKQRITLAIFEIESPKFITNYNSLSISERRALITTEYELAQKKELLLKQKYANITREIKHLNI